MKPNTPAAQISVREKHEQGFSMMELLVVMVVLAVVLAMIIGIITTAQARYTADRVRMEKTNDANATLDTFVRLIRNAGNNTNLIPISADPNADGIFNDIQIRSDWHPQDNDVLDAFENIQFRVSNGVLQKNETSIDGFAWTPFMENVQSLTFTYFDAAGAAMATPQTNHANIVSVRITIVTTAPNPMTYSTFATVRERR